MFLRTARTQTIPFQWSEGGRTYQVDGKVVNLPRKVGNSRVHTTPPVLVGKSRIPGAGLGVFVSAQVLIAGMIIADYDGDWISIEDAYLLELLVSSRAQPLLSPHTNNNAFIF